MHTQFLQVYRYMHNYVSACLHVRGGKVKQGHPEPECAQQQQQIEQTDVSLTRLCDYRGRVGHVVVHRRPVVTTLTRRNVVVLTKI